jgi:predicted nucleic acid-binding protein
MSYLLDTCVLSEARKPNADARVIDWLERIDESRLFLSAVTLGEIQKGISKLEESQRRRALQIWLEQDLSQRFTGRILPMDAETALEWGRLQGQAARAGRTLPVIDSLIAATAIRHGLILATRNTADFEGVPMKLLNPWLDAVPLHSGSTV